MAFDGVPWAIGGGADITADVIRTFTNIATHDTEGVNLPGDFRVSALNTPGPMVTIAGGGITIRNAQQAGQSYVGAAGSDTDVNVSANASGATRHDLVIARIIDPDFSPWQPYTDPNMILDGPYFEPFVVSGVPSNAQTAADAGITYAAYALARLDIPNGTSNITDAMIVDLRHLAQPRSSTVDDVQVAPGDGSGNPSYLTTSDTTWTDWPNNSLAVDVPYWATTAIVTIGLNQVQIDGDGDFQSRVNLGGLTGTSANFDYNKPNANPAGLVVGVPFTLYAELDVTGLQGQTVTLKPQTERTYGSTNTADIWMGGGTSPSQQVIFAVRFEERTV